MIVKYSFLSDMQYETVNPISGGEGGGALGVIVVRVYELAFRNLPIHTPGL